MNPVLHQIADSKRKPSSCLVHTTKYVIQHTYCSSLITKLPQDLADQAPPIQEAGLSAIRELVLSEWPTNTDMTDLRHTASRNHAPEPHVILSSSIFYDSYHPSSGSYHFR